MPSRKLHNKFAEAFGISHELADRVNADIDRPSKLLGPSHRRVNHDLNYAIYLGLKYKDVNATIGAILHYRLDEASKDPKVRKMLKIAEALS